ncbi:MAG TPA: 2-oxoacid:acceptor oxidoreductase family protein [Bacteroidota bacterium]|nr:2-oxoacid:acceptor oxidoreductase family protein [Bacteroidota bacterium]
MKSEEIVVAGFGGQGVLSFGQILAYAAMMEGKEVSWMPSYGPEMRGGTANCIVIISPTRISSPIVTQFDTAVVFNQPSLDKFHPRIKKGGLLLYEQDGIINPPYREDIDILPVPAVREAIRLGKKQIGNMIMMGALLARRPLVSLDAVLVALKKSLPERHHHMIPLNEEGLRVGRQLAEKSRHEPSVLFPTES